MGDIFRQLNDNLFGKKLFIRFTARAFRKLLSIYAFIYFPFGFEGGIWDLMVSVPDHCLSSYFRLNHVFKILNQTCSFYLSEHFRKVSDFHMHNTRESSENFVVHTCLGIIPQLSSSVAI